MTDLNDRYFEWVFDLVGHPKHYRKLLMHLHSSQFEYQLEMDGNRFADGVDLRYRFGYDRNISNPEIANGIDNRPCSILELMAALALRCEENIMANPAYGSRLTKWFWEMVESLGLIEMDDDHYDRNYVNYVIKRFNDRRYRPDGAGGLFTIKGCTDIPDLEIWRQMCRYLNTLGG